ncbi:2-hydroxyacid dehydrogenase [Thermoplasma sp. Kam2015]|uniref:2-hydroxyacid dehydrogenase n=1 Tax=Thermoplasma sp. Kam2015 TaxID=2094122 RepID=UPI000D91D926|nr:2-hydroxyacid dehydrogenase [Thermoplasma sp. Kam2015]PYB68232.1 2-hydroxyacid dehydrogenase [Thermoplasma sp. Kam2015]
MDVYINFPVDTHVRKIAESILQDFDLHWFPDYFDAEVQIIKDRYVLGNRTKMIQTISAGVDHIDVAGIPDKIILCSNAGAYSISVAEHTFALILSHAKNIIENNSLMKSGTFKQSPTTLLYGKTLGIVGYGGIGRRVAEIGKAFGMKIAAYTRSGADDNVDKLTDDVAELFASSDMIVLSIPLTDKTKGMINYKILQKTKKNAFIVNVARADIVLKSDMLRFLRENPDRWYLSDVWWDEPNIKDADLPNLILSPHVAGGMSGEIMDTALRLAFENVKNFFDGHPRNVVKKEEYKMKSERFLGI